jgi:hypothetical protein
MTSFWDLIVYSFFQHPAEVCTTCCCVWLSFTYNMQKNTIYIWNSDPGSDLKNVSYLHQWIWNMKVTQWNCTDWKKPWFRH